MGVPQRRKREDPWVLGGEGTGTHAYAYAHAHFKALYDGQWQPVKCLSHLMLIVFLFVYISRELQALCDLSWTTSSYPIKKYKN